MPKNALRTTLNSKPMTVINIDESIFLDTYENFERCLLPLVNQRRIESGKRAMTDDEAINYFIDLRRDFGLDAAREGIK